MDLAGDVEGGVYARIVGICQLFPSISPFPAGSHGSVWDLPWEMWVMFASAVDSRMKEG